MYFNEILNITSNLTGFLFDDDYQDYLEVNLEDLESGIALVNSDLVQQIQNWLSARGLALDISKSKAMIISKITQTNLINKNSLSAITITKNWSFVKTLKTSESYLMKIRHFKLITILNYKKSMYH